ncbi:hypothetical protein CEXT_203731 [Caerostris extrusa]|uniref:Uncharacterized protein n=1 Tax=Caerostris extrusa TaxID=172846 RepID=A0AAV4NWM1_CAEEX|nr:hypothetical protein CEXT_203731 [Caerostris extrusa]
MNEGVYTLAFINPQFVCTCASEFVITDHYNVMKTGPHRRVRHYGRKGLECLGDSFQCQRVPLSLTQGRRLQCVACFERRVLCTPFIVKVFSFCSP